MGVQEVSPPIRNSTWVKGIWVIVKSVGARRMTQLLNPKPPPP